MKIALTTPGVSPYVMGGIQRHSFNLARHLTCLGIDVDLYHTDFGKSLNIDDLDGFSAVERRRVTSLPLPWPEGDNRIGHYLRETKKFSMMIWEQMRAREPVDCVYGQGLTAWAIVEARRSGERSPPVMVNLHGYEMFQPAASWRSSLEGFMMRPSFRSHARKADRVVSLGGKLTELIVKRVGVKRNQIVELPVGIDPSWIKDGVHPERLRTRFIFVGRNERRKGIVELHSVILRHPEWQHVAEFRFVGPIPEGQRLRLPHVSYAGAVMVEHELQVELSEADVLICPSHSEGMPTVILEAMASGLAVIATDVGASAVLVNQDNGILIPRCENARLASAIEEMLALNSIELNRKQQESSKRVREFTWDKIARKTLDAMMTL